MEDPPETDSSRSVEVATDHDAAIGKRRARGNRIGAIGEAAFRHLASREGLLPTKLEEDVGLDFVCQVDKDPDSASPSEVAGSVVGFAVRTTTSVDGRITLTRSDAVALLRADFRVCIVLIKSRDGDDTGWFAPLDADNRNRLHDFLASDAATHSLTPADCQPWSELRSWLQGAVVAGATEQEKLRAAEHRLGEALGEVRLEVRRDGGGSTTVVTVMDLYRSFSMLDETERDALYVATFGAAGRASSRMAALALRRELISPLDELPWPIVLAGFTQADDCVLRVDGENGVAECAFIKTSNGEHVGWCRGNGFALTASRSRRQGDIWVHELASFADPDESINLDTDRPLLDFLACCTSDARIGEAGTDPLPFFVEQFGELPLYGWFAAYLKRAETLEGWTSAAAALNDATDEETLDTLAWLAALADRPNAVARVAFTLDADGQPDKPASFTVPVLTNTTRATVISWLDCEGHVLLDNDDRSLLGIAIAEVRSVVLEVRERIPKQTSSPEFIFDRHVAIARGADSFHQVELDEAVIGTSLQMVHLQVNGLEDVQGLERPPESSGS